MSRRAVREGLPAYRGPTHSVDRADTTPSIIHVQTAQIFLVRVHGAQATACESDFLAGEIGRHGRPEKLATGIRCQTHREMLAVTICGTRRFPGRYLVERNHRNVTC